MAKELDTTVEAFRTRPLDAGPYTFVAADALVLKVRENGRVVNVHALIAVGISAEGHREILGLEVSTAEDGAGWLSFLRSGATWQRCRTHYADVRIMPTLVVKPLVVGGDTTCANYRSSTCTWRVSGLGVEIAMRPYR